MYFILTINKNKEIKMQYLSITEASKKKKISRGSIYVAIAREKLDTTKIGGRIVILKNKKYRDYRK